MLLPVGKFMARACALSLFLTVFASAQQKSFEGTWQMDPAKSHVSDGRVVTLTITNVANGIKMVMKTVKKDGQEINAQFTSKLDGKACDLAEGDHKAQLTAWFNGPALNATKEGGGADDKTSAWKFELGQDKQTMTMTINHYDPAGDDETLLFVKKP
jgi:hypothetical protein